MEGLWIHSRSATGGVGGIISIGVADRNRLARARAREGERERERSKGSAATSDRLNFSSSSSDFVFVFSLSALLMPPPATRRTDGRKLNKPLVPPLALFLLLSSDQAVRRLTAREHVVAM